MHWAAQDALERAYRALEDVLKNYPARAAARFVRVVSFPFGYPKFRPSDRLLASVAASVQTPGESRERLLAGSYLPKPEVDKVVYGELAFQLSPQIERIEQRVKPAIKEGRIEALPQVPWAFPAWQAKALKLGLISPEEAELLARFVKYADYGVQVDDFAQDFGLEEALRQRRTATNKSEGNVQRLRAGNGLASSTTH